MATFKLDLRPLFRRLAREEQSRYADAVAAQGGGSLPRQIKAARVRSVRKWGYKLKLASLGQKLTWYVRGTVRQPARPVPEGIELTEAQLADAVEAEVAGVFAAFDERAR